MFGRRSLPALQAAPRLTQGAPDEAARTRSKRLILLWATIAALVVGVLHAGQPFEDYLRMMRNKLRMHPPSGEIVVAKIDDKSLAKLGEWPYARRYHAALIDRLKAGGARRIVFDVMFANKSNATDDRMFAAALQRAGNVALATTDNIDPMTRAPAAQLPIEIFRPYVKLVSAKIHYSNLAMIRRLDFAPSSAGGVFPSIAAYLADYRGPKNGGFEIDYATSLTHIPSVSVGDVIDNSADASIFKGKDVIVAMASRSGGDLFFVPTRGLVNGAYVHVVGAETLKAGMPTSLGWLLPFMLAVGLAALHIVAKQRWLSTVALVTSMFVLFVLPVVAESNHVFYDVMPALILTLSVAIGRAWINFRQSYKVRGNINAVSGLPNLNALREEQVADDAVVVAARVRNFAEISSSLPPEAERALVEQITARLALGARGARIYQGDEGVFAWACSIDVAGPDQLDALHALFRSPALVDGRQIDLSVTFGTDADNERSLANRIGATLVAADEAAAEGLRWKAYDSAKLADAEWKLSLLGRLDAAIDSGEIWVAYQPQLELATGRICGAEALVRWSHPEKGEVSPAEFVLAAEQHDRIDKLTEFVLSDAVRTAAAFNARGIDFDVAVNISARLLEGRGLVDLVRRQLHDSRLDPARLTLEVTESAAMASGRASIRTLEEIGSLGINVSIDDYGTGFSTLDYFKKIPATEVKIDRGFVAAIDRNASDRLMVRSTIELAHSLGRSVVAEGVESSEILTELTNLGCDKAQGYLIGRPMKIVSLSKLVLGRSNARAA